MKKLLILGGSYFIGKHVVNALKNTYDTYVLNRGRRPLGDAAITELVCDRNDHKQLKAVLKPHTFSYVVDISCFNSEQATGLLEALNLDALIKYVFISTSAVYDINQAQPPFKETDPLGGDSPFKAYAKNKIQAEDLLGKTLDKAQLTIFRPPFVYGEDNYLLRERLFFYLIENNLPIYVPTTNNHIHFVYVKDLAVDTKKALANTIPSGVYNVGYAASHTFIAYINLCATTVGKQANIVNIDAHKHKPKLSDYFPFFAYDNVLSVKKIKTYAPEDTPVEMGLKNAYQDYLSIKDSLKLPNKMVAARKELSKKQMG